MFVCNFAFAGNNLWKDYRNDVELANLVRCFRALAFVPCEDVEYAFNELVTSKKYDKRLNPFCAYFKVSFDRNIFRILSIDNLTAATIIDGPPLKRH